MPKNKHNRSKWLLIVSAITGFAGFFVAIFKKERLKKLISNQKREIRELTEGQEDIGEFTRDSVNIFKDFFIPHEGNDHKPKALRPKSLMAYAVLAIVAKVAVTGVLFFSYPTPAQLTAIVADRMVQLANEARAAIGVAPLTVNQDLVAAATRKGQDMLERDYFAHDTPEGIRPWQWIDTNVYDYIYAGENLAMDFTSAEAIQAAFMKSPGHRRNILNERYEETGMAVLRGELDGSETILLVQFFGAQRNSVNTSLAATQPETAPAPAAVPEQPIVESPVDPTPVTAPTPEPVITPPTPVAPELQPEVQVQPVSPSISNTPEPAVAGNELVEPTPVPEENPTELAVRTLPSLATLEAGIPSGGALTVSIAPNQHSLVGLVVKYSNIFFLAFLLFVSIAFILNFVVKIRIQHSSVILQTIAVIALLASLLLTNLSTSQSVATQLLIL